MQPFEEVFSTSTVFMETYKPHIFYNLIFRNADVTYTYYEVSVSISQMHFCCKDKSVNAIYENNRRLL
jgi:hypothetical protein